MWGRFRPEPGVLDSRKDRADSGMDGTGTSITTYMDLLVRYVAALA